MKVPISWLKDYVDIDLSIEALAELLSNAGFEIEEIRLVGLSVPPAEKREFKISGLSWEPDKLVVAQIDEVMPHPNADRLVLCRLNDGSQAHIVLTGAPNLFEYKGQGALPQPLKVAYAREGARIYDGHQPGQVLTTLKRAKIRGVESYSMVCSEKELGISDEHEGVIILDPDAPTGMPLVDYMGDAVFEVAILPNMIRNACIYGLAREIAALTGKPLRSPQTGFNFDGPGIAGRVSIDIRDPELNPRFVVGLIENVTLRPSPYLVQRRLRLAGMRPINNIVDATNYIMLTIGEPLHAFDYDVLVARAGGVAPTIITRAAEPGEHLTTLDGEDHVLDPFNVLVCDTAGALSLAGVMGGLESEVSPGTRNVLLEGASWNYINIRRTMASQRMFSEAGYRFSRGIHPALAPWGVQLCLEAMRAWSGGVVSRGLVDNYAQPAVDPVVAVSAQDAKRLLGLDMSAEEIARLITPLGFECRIEGDTVIAQTPPTRVDIGDGLVGKADILEEVARMYGYDRVPATRMEDLMPPLRRDARREGIDRAKDLLASLGLQEIISYRLTSPEREARLAPAGGEYLRLANPIAPDRNVMRRSVLASVMEALERNSRLRARLALFEAGPAFLPEQGDVLPAEPVRLAIAMTGWRDLPAWDTPARQMLDFYDLKGLLEALFAELHLGQIQYQPAQDARFHPGKCAEIHSGETVFGIFGELHPLVKAHYDLGEAAVIAADIDLEAVVGAIPRLFDLAPVPAYPPVLEDIAVIVDEGIPAGQVEQAIWQAGGKVLAAARLFDIYRGEQIGAGKKSLAYSLTYQSADRTLTDADAAAIRGRIVRALEQSLGAKLRS